MQNTAPVINESKTTNIIQFPGINKNFINSASLEELMEQATQNRIDFVEFMVSDILEELFFKLNIVGFDFNDAAYIKDMMFVSESLKSLILKSMGINHGLQIAAEELIDFKNDD